MKKSAIILTTILSLGMVAGSLAALKMAHVKEEQRIIQAKAEGEVNDTFVKIYNDNNNNVANGSALNKTLFCFSGTAHGLADGTSLDDATTLGNIKLNGTALSAADGSKVYVWGGQNWFYIIYPKTTAEGSTLEILEGLTVGDSVVEGLKFTLNADGLWRRTYSEPINATYNKIYPNAAFNSSTNILIVYNGTAITPNITISAVEELKNWDNYISYNGNPISSVTSAELRSYSSAQTWFWIRFAAASTGDRLVIKEGCKFDTAVFDSMAFEFNGTEWEWSYYFNEPINATYSSIYSDTYNNGTHATGYNRLMFKYTGAAHNHSAAFTSKYELMKFDHYIQIDGTPISAYYGGSTQVAPWNAQTWIQIIYPATAVSVGSKLAIKQGCKIGDAVFNEIVFTLNSKSKWITAPIEDDPLVKNSDYSLFTLNSASFATHSQYPYYSGSSIDELTSHNFCVQFNITAETDARDPFYVRFGSSALGNQYVDLCVDVKGNKNLYIRKFNGTTSNIASTVKSFAMENGVTYKFEFYSIMDSDSTVVFLLGIDGETIFKTESLSLGANPVDCSYFCIFRTTDGDTSIAFTPCATTDTEAINRFAKRKLHSEDIAFDNNSNTGACLNYYAGAKAYYTNHLFKTQKIAFSSENSYADLRARFVAWAAANGETLSFNASTGALVIASNYAPLAIITKNENLVAAIIALVFIGISTSFAVLWILRKRKLAK